MLKWLIPLSIGVVAVISFPETEGAALDSPTTRNVEVSFDEPSEGNSLSELSDRVGATPAIQAEFDMVGLLWDGGEIEALWLQVQDVEGTWGDWIEVPVDADHGPDDSEGRAGSAPVYTGPSTAFRFAVVGAPVGAEAMLLDTSALADSSQQANSTRQFAAGTGLNSNPPAPSWPGAAFVRDRSQWDMDNCRREGAETNFSSAKAIVIHHTAATNNYSESQVPGIIAGHCYFHVNGRGWDDLGYNFMVDRFGNVWEGRTGSKTSPVQGAHTAGFNSQTQGVALMGNFDSATPTSATVSGLRQILDWMTGWHSINPTGQVTLEAKAGAVGFEEGEVVTIPSIIGHRDLGSTTCPGGVFYATLATLRTQVTPVSFGYQPSQLRCDNQPVTIFGTPGNDLIYGTDGPDVIHGILGNDWIFGLGGDDRICGNSGDDGLIGGGGFDRLFGDGGQDACGGEFRNGCESIPNDEIFFYRSDGLFRYYDIADNGVIGAPMLAGSGYTTGWDAITGVDLEGDGQDEMFFYRSDGLFRFYDVLPDGTIGKPLLAGSGYTTGWDVIIALDVDGDAADEMFFYRDDGLFRFYDVNEDGSLPAPFSSGNNYTTGWDQIVAIDLDGDVQDEMFFYRDDGLFRFYQVNEDATLPTPMLAGTGYTTGWDAITSIDLDGDHQDEMFFYRSDGLFRYYHINENGVLPKPLLGGNGYTTGWSVITSLELQPGP